ncbi:ionotropic receptor 84a [Musca autumnalis]|uniref:ionotropic receptor 84a n=1 Tax=Musca autumnalis TaxID=221902 RepID=UPI003CF619CD
MELFNIFKILCFNLGIIITILGQSACYGRSSELQAFKKYLEFKNLKQAIIIYGGAARNHYSFETLHQDSNRTSHYYLTFFNLNNLKSDTDIKKLFRGNSPRMGIFITHSACDTMENRFLIKSSENLLFNNSLSWFIVLKNDCNKNNQPNLKDNIQAVFGNLNILINADVTVAVKRKKCFLDLVDIYKICQTCNDNKLTVEYKGNFSQENGFLVEKDFMQLFVLRRRNFENTSVAVATALVNYSPTLNMSISEYLNDNKRYLQNDFMQRKTYQLMSITQDIYNFSFHLRIEDEWGLFTNGTWTGVLGLLNNHEIEFTLLPLRYMSERLHIISYTPEVHVELVRFLLRHPKRTGIRNIFFEPLTVTVWWSVLAIIVITGIMLGIHVHAEYQLYWKLKTLQPHQSAATTLQQLVPEHKLDFIVLTILEAAFMQGPTPEHFHANSTRLLLTSVSVFALLLMQFYAAFIVSSLLSEAPRTITTLDALYNSSLEIGMENAWYNYDMFNTTTTTTNPLVRTIFKNRICKNGKRNILTLEEGVQRVAKGGFAFHVTLSRVYQLLVDILTESQFCELQEISFSNPFTTGIGVEKTSPYFEYLKSAILKFRESGILKYSDLVWKVPKIDCAALAKNDVEVDMEHFAPVLVFLAFAIMTSVWVFVFEYLYKSYKIVYKTMRKCLRK